MMKVGIFSKTSNNNIPRVIRQVGSGRIECMIERTEVYAGLTPNLRGRKDV